MDEDADKRKNLIPTIKGDARISLLQVGEGGPLATDEDADQRKNLPPRAVEGDARIAFPSGEGAEVRGG